MANTLYPTGRNAFLTGDIDWVADTIKAILIDSADYTYSAAHDFLDDVPSGARVATATLANKSASGGTADADDVTFATVTGDQSEAVILYKDSGVEGTSQLIAYLDTFASGMPVLPNGGNIVLTWDSGANKIFTL